jgi:hypothetical protein
MLTKHPSLGRFGRETMKGISAILCRSTIDRISLAFAHSSQDLTNCYDVARSQTPGLGWYHFLSSLSLDSPISQVTGASGFLGFHVVHQLLEAGYAVRGCATFSLRMSKIF